MRVHDSSRAERLPMPREDSAALKSDEKARATGALAVRHLTNK
jgi:hypothetical protein